MNIKKRIDINFQTMHLSSGYEITKSVLTLFEEHINLCLFFLNISSLRKSSHYVTDPRNDE